jgi:hypothetical protein
MNYSNFDIALKEISQFWDDMPFGKGEGDTFLTQLQGHIPYTFPQELQIYIRNVSPLRSIELRTVGNSIILYGSKFLSHHLPGYNFNEITKEPLTDWLSSWFLIADEGVDPIIVDLKRVDNSDKQCKVYQAIHGSGVWNFFRIASSLPQFLLLASAQHHILTTFGKDIILDDEQGFRLRDDAAKWLFPRLKEYDAEVYDIWTQSFDNA